MITWAERFEAMRAFACVLLVAVVPPILMALA
jgi:preprotein translocase subunit SecE